MNLFWVLAGILGSILLSLPIAFALAAVAIIIILSQDMSLLIVPQRLYGGVNSFPLLAVPFFILAGQIMNYAGISNELMAVARALVGRMRGGLAAVNVIMSMFFAGMSGSCMADTAAVGGIIVPAMISRGYDRAFTGAVTAASSTIGIIIPPSIPMVLLGAFLGMSVGALFAAGLVAGVMVGGGEIIVSWIISKRKNYPVEEPFKLSVVVRAVVRATPALITPLIILGGILGGVFTPTEASAVAVIYSVFIGVFYYKTLSAKVLYKVFAESAVMTGAVMLVTATAYLLGYTFTFLGIAEGALKPLVALNMSKEAYLILFSFIMIIAGVFLDGIAMMYIIVPLFFPATKALGIDPVHFGMVVILCWGIGQQTPPVAAALYITCALTKTDAISITRANIPFIGVMVVVTVLIIFFPEALVLGLPKLLGF
jgi:TRAP-type transport system large permease protein